MEKIERWEIQTDGEYRQIEIRWRQTDGDNRQMQNIDR